MKKVIAILAACTMCFALMGCQATATDEKTSTDPVVNETTTETGTETAAESETEKETEVAIQPQINIKRNVLDSAPTMLKKLTGVEDIDYKAYLENQVFTKSYMEKGSSVLRTVEVYTLADAEDATALYLMIEDDFVKKAYMDEFSGAYTPNFTVDAYVVAFPEAAEFAVAMDKLAINEEDLAAASADLTAKYEGKNATELLTDLEVMSPEVSYESVESGDVYVTYTVKNPKSTDDENVDYTLGVLMNADGVISQMFVTPASADVVVPFL